MKAVTRTATFATVRIGTHEYETGEWGDDSVRTSDYGTPSGALAAGIITESGRLADGVSIVGGSFDDDPRIPMGKKRRRGRWASEDLEVRLELNDDDIRYLREEWGAEVVDVETRESATVVADNESLTGYEPATERQIDYARDLGIDVVYVSWSKAAISEEIDRARNGQYVEYKAGRASDSSALVCVGCGDAIAEGLAMSSAQGVSCPACYDRMSA